MIKEHLSLLIRHLAWADRRTLDALNALPDVPVREVRLFGHILAAEQIYLARMRAEDPFPQVFWPEHALDRSREQMDPVHDALYSFVDDLSEEQLTRSVRYRNSAGIYYETPVSHMLTHLCLHGEHHRGQIAIQVRNSGYPPAVTDLITFVREEV